MSVLDLFAGPGGFDEGLRMAGRTDVLGIEWDETACATARANGHRRLCADVASLNPTQVVADHCNGHLDGFIASPPCTSFSLAGHGKGREQLEDILSDADRMAAGLPTVAAYLDPTTPLVLEPIRWVRELMPKWVAMEQVPTVLPIWEHFAGIFRGLGYSVATGVLHAEAYGVPQTRKRAFLVAALDWQARLPDPTHSRYYPRNKAKLDPGVLPWVSMGEALGIQEGAQIALRSNYGTGGDPKNRGIRLASEPASTITTRAGRNKWADVSHFHMGNQKNAAIRRIDEPAPSMAFGHNRTAGVFIPSDVDPRIGLPMNASDRPSSAVQLSPGDAAILQSFPVDYIWHGGVTKRFEQIGNAVPPVLAMRVLRAIGAVSTLDIAS